MSPTWAMSPTWMSHGMSHCPQATWCVWDITHSCVWLDLFMCVTRLIITSHIWINRVSHLKSYPPCRWVLWHTWINKTSVNPKSTSNQSSTPCTVLQYPSKKSCLPCWWVLWHVSHINKSGHTHEWVMSHTPCCLEEMTHYVTHSYGRHHSCGRHDSLWVTWLIHMGDTTQYVTHS